MISKTKHPKIKVRLTSFDWFLEAISIAFLVILILLPLLFLNDLPEKIPIHFNAAGQPDNYGNKLSLGILPLAGIVLYLLLTVLSNFPHVYNFPVKITPENATIQYRLAIRLLRILKALIVIIYSFLCFTTIQTALGNTSGIGKSILPIILISIFGVIIIYIVQSLNNRQVS